MNLFSYFTSLKPFVVAFNQSDIFGKLIMLALVALSLVCWLIIIQKKQEFKKIKLIQTQVVQETLQLKNPLSGYEPQDKSHPFAQVFLQFKTKAQDLLSKNRYFAPEGTQTVYLSQTDLTMIDQVTTLSIEESMNLLETRVNSLSTITTLAPFLGLLGTVWGILMSFSELATGAGSTQSSTVIGGLSMALATTVMGLVIAIPALIGYNHLRQALKLTESELATYAAKLLSTLELHYRKVDL
jgi:biopolymer transport protein TolQ